jgi:SAM-dependent methyltransferase
MMSEMANKLKVISNLGMTFDNKIILDVGGIKSYQKDLESVFRNSYITIVNINKHHGPNIIADANNLPIKNNSVDIITSFDMIEHLYDPEKFLEEARRVLKDDGLLIVATPNLADIYSRFAFLLGYMPFPYDACSIRVGRLVRTKAYISDRGHKSVLNYKAITELLKYDGYRIKFITGFSYNEYLNNDRGIGHYNLRNYINNILPSSLREGLIIICQK